MSGSSTTSRLRVKLTANCGWQSISRGSKRLKHDGDYAAATRNWESSTCSIPPAFKEETTSSAFANRIENEPHSPRHSMAELELLPRECIYFGPCTSLIPTILEEAVNFL